MSASPRIGYVVFARTEARLVSATLASLVRQTESAAVVLMMVPAERRHVFDRSALAQFGALRIETIHCDHTDNDRSSALRAMAARVDVAVFVPEGLVLRPDHCASTRTLFAGWEHIAARLEIADKCRPVEPRSAMTGLPAEVENTAVQRAYRRWFRPRLLMQSALTVRLRMARGIEFERVNENCDWLAFRLFQQKLKMRGGVCAEFSDRMYQVRPQPDQRWRYETSYDVYRTLFRIAALDDKGAVNTRLEVVRLLIDLLEELIVFRRKRWPVRRVLQGMLAARRDAEKTRRALNRDMKEIGFG